MIHISEPPVVAVIDEGRCIGCALCIAACPVDAISGAAKLMHTVIAAECTGCELCLAPCPVDCIEMIEVDAVRSPAERAEHARRRYEARRARLETRRGATRAARPGAASGESAESRKRATIERVMKRATERLHSKPGTRD